MQSCSYHLVQEIYGTGLSCTFTKPCQILCSYSSLDEACCDLLKIQIEQNSPNDYLIIYNENSVCEIEDFFNDHPLYPIYFFHPGYKLDIQPIISMIGEPTYEAAILREYSLKTVVSVNLSAYGLNQFKMKLLTYNKLLKLSKSDLFIIYQMFGLRKCRKFFTSKKTLISRLWKLGKQIDDYFYYR